MRAAAGMSYRSCSKLTCFGPQLSFGYHRQQVEYSPDFLVDPDGYTQKRHDMFVEARLLGRVRLIQGWLAFELSLGVRGTYATVNQRTGDEDRSTAFVGALGIYATICPQ